MPKEEIVPICKTSAAYERVTVAGFVFGPIRKNTFDCIETYSFNFKCPCGQLEALSYSETRLSQRQRSGCSWINEKGEFDAAAAIEFHGSTSEAHLRADGFSEDAIRQIRSAYNDQKPTNNQQFRGY